MSQRCSGPTMELLKSDILDLDVDVIVNSANPSLLAGGGVCGAIHRAAGPQLEEASRALGPISPGGAVVTLGFNLKAKFVIHAVAPRYMYGNEEEERQLQSAYATALVLASRLEGVSSIAFPSMGTGIYRWPLDKAAEIAVAVLQESQLGRTIMCARDDETFVAYSRALEIARANDTSEWNDGVTF
jgi:O-acetyl-ADP-ribose deacetylase (regulator of RNase III)